MWAPGSPASVGVQTVAEMGNSSSLTSDLSTAQTAGTVLQYLTGSGADQQTVNITVDSGHAYVSFMTMLAPSPDWFTGFQDLSLCRGGNWVDAITITVQPWDAGTDCGTTFTSANCAGGTTNGSSAVPVYEITPTTTTSAGVFVNNNAVLPMATITFTRRTYNVVSETPGMRPVACAGGQRYNMQVQSLWTGARHPADYPSNAHFSPIVVASHNTTYQMWAPGSPASVGVQTVAEMGNSSSLTSDLSTAQTAGTVLQYLTGSGADQQTVNITVDSGHAYVSFMTMLAPSPDWFTGFQDLSLCRGGNWVDAITITVQPWDAGTDCGTTFTSANCAGGTTNGSSAVPVYEITPTTTTSAGVFVNNNAVLPMATIALTRVPGHCDCIGVSHPDAVTYGADYGARCAAWNSRKCGEYLPNQTLDATCCASFCYVNPNCSTAVPDPTGSGLFVSYAATNCTNDTQLEASCPWVGAPMNSVVDWAQQPYDPCSCGNVSHPDTARYGAGFGNQCKAWDLDYCSLNYPGVTPGQFCCNSWCYVTSPACPVASTREMGLYYSYHPCTSFNSTCPWIGVPTGAAVNWHDFLTRSVLNEVTTSPETLKAAMPGITVTKKFDLASNTRAVAVINTTLDPMYSLQQNIWYKRPFMMNFPKEASVAIALVGEATETTLWNVTNNPLQISRFQTEVLKVLLYTSEGVPVIDKPFSFEKQVWNTNWVTFLRFPTEGGEARSVLAEGGSVYYGSQGLPYWNVSAVGASTFVGGCFGCCPNAGMFLAGYTSEGVVTYPSLDTAMSRCDVLPDCYGVTLDFSSGTNVYTNRAGTVLTASPKDEVSWVKSECQGTNSPNALQTTFYPLDRASISHVVLSFQGTALALGNELWVTLPPGFTLGRCAPHGNSLCDTQVMLATTDGVAVPHTLLVADVQGSTRLQFAFGANYTLNKHMQIKLNNVMLPNHCEDASYRMDAMYCVLNAWGTRYCYDPIKTWVSTYNTNMDPDGVAQGCSLCNACRPGVYDMWECNHNGIEFATEAKPPGTCVI